MFCWVILNPPHTLLQTNPQICTFYPPRWPQITPHTCSNPPPPPPTLLQNTPKIGNFTPHRVTNYPPHMLTITPPTLLQITPLSQIATPPPTFTPRKE